MWLPVLVTLTVNADDGVHSEIQTLRFPNEHTCDKAATALDKMALSALGSNALNWLRRRNALQRRAP
jgi:hypothetical protein